ncbi:MAG: M18 family aminopeptidase [Lachnospiraceae bacterium]|nr:M18 family aminopeptidase [Lachnospiraceae bacterium]
MADNKDLHQTIHGAAPDGQSAVHTQISGTQQQLLQFLAQSPTAFHAAHTIRRILLDAGYEELIESSSWQLTAGGRYFVMRAESSIISFRIPHSRPSGFMIAASHTDSPTMKIKVNPEVEGNGYIRLNTEGYGGLIMQSWFDRPLSVAGRVVVRTDEGVRSVLVRVDRDLLMIPRLAIHMDRTQNDGQKIDMQRDMLPIYGLSSSKGTFMDVIAQEAGCKPEEILAHDLFLYARGRGTVWGAQNEFISGGHLDDLQCGFADLHGYLAANEAESVPVLAVFDNEEVGSRSRQGADSGFLTDILHRIADALSFGDEGFRILTAGSFMVSADNAHAVHPARPDVADPVNRPALNKGPVIKYHAAQRYTTDALSAAVFKEVCARAGVPFQEFTNRSGSLGGSTLGHQSMTHFSIPTVDVGLPQLSMHSAYETAGTADTDYMIEAMKVFFSSSLRNEGHDQYQLVTNK